MKRSIIRVSLIVTALLVPGLAAANIALAPIMRHWHQVRRQIDAMLEGNYPFDPGKIRASMHLYAADALVTSTQVIGKSAAARDFAARFAQFAKDANRADAASGTLATFLPYAQRLNSDCEACHAIYNN